MLSDPSGCLLFYVLCVCQSPVCAVIFRGVICVCFWSLLFCMDYFVSFVIGMGLLSYGELCQSALSSMHVLVCIYEHVLCMCVRTFF